MLVKPQELIKHPKEARKRNITGKVMVRVLVDTSGIPIKHEILRSPDPILTEAALKGIYHLRFSPAIQDGEPIKFWTTVPIDFNIKAQPKTDKPDKK